MKGSVTEAGKRLRKSNRGHRRAFSVPNASGDRTRMPVVEENDFPVTVIFLGNLVILLQKYCEWSNV